MSQTFAVMDVNPNEGGGCLCSEIGTQDSQGPFVVFNATEQESNASPFPVLCSGCAIKSADLIARAGQKSAAHLASQRPAKRRRAADEDGPQI